MGAFPLESLEARHLLAFDFAAAYVQADEPFYTRADDNLNHVVISESPQQIVLRFTPGIVIDPNSVAEGVVIKRSGGANDPFDDAGDQGSTPDVLVTPGAVVVDDAPNQNQIIVRFQESLPDDMYRITLSSEFTTDALGNQVLSGIQTVSAVTGEFGTAFRDGGSFSFDVRLSVGQQVVAVVPQPIARDSSNVLSQDRNKVVVYFDDFEKLDKDSVETITHYNLIEVDSSGTEGNLINPSSVVYNAQDNTAELIFGGGIPDGKTYRLEIGGGGIVPAKVAVAGNADITSFATSQALGQLNAAGVEITGVISPRPRVNTPVGTLDIPVQSGSVNELGHRDNPIEAHGLPEITAGTATAITETFYNFKSNYGTDPQGNQLFNQITETQKQRAREIFELYSRYLGIQFTESADLGITVVTGDMRALDPLINTAPAGLGGGNMAIMDSTDDWGESEYGGGWFRVAMHEIGHCLGLTHSYDVPSNMGGGLTGEAVFPGDYDLIHASQLYPQTGSDIDVYQFTLPASGDFTAEIFASRPGQPILDTLDSVLTLYREDPATGVRTMVARNDDSFGRDSRIELALEKSTPGGGDYIYFVAVTSKGNTDFNPEIEESGAGGQTDGWYRLSLTHVPESTATTSIVDESGTVLDGDRDGSPGGSFNFWFRTAANSNTIFVDKVAGVAATVTADGTDQAGDYFVVVDQAADVSVGMGVVGSGVADGVTVAAIEYLMTASSTPVITGAATVAANETLTVELNGVAYTVGDGNLEFDGNRWKLMVPSGNSLGNGTYEAVVKVTDQAGNVSTSSGNIFIKNTLPVDPTVDSLLTNDTTPTITGTATIGAFDWLTVEVNGVTYTLGDGNLTISGTDWTLVVPPGDSLSQGTYSVTATTTNSSGEATTGRADLRIDTTAPVAPAVVSLTTSSSTPTVTGTATLEVDETLTVEVNAVTYTAGDGNLTLSGIGWALVVPGGDALLNGAYTVTATVTDAAGNASAGTGNLEVNSALPVDPTVDSLVTNNVGPTVTGSATVGSSPGDGFAVVINGVTYALGIDAELTYDNGTNAWALDLTALTLAEATYPVTAITTNSVGSTTGVSYLVIDTAVPTAPTVAGLTASTLTPTVTGTATLVADETLTVEVNAVTYTAGDGNLTLTDTEWVLVVPVGDALSNGTYTVTATVTDAAGNAAAGTGTLEVNDALPDAPTVVTLATNSPSPIVEGTASVDPDGGDSLEVVVGGRSYSLTDAELAYDAVGSTWTLDLSAEAFGEGVHSVAVTATNSNGSIVTAANFVVDLTAPATPVFDPAVRVKLSGSVSLQGGQQLRFFDQPDGSLAKPFLNIDEALQSVVPGNTAIIRIVGNNELAPNDASENYSHYQIGQDAAGNTLADGRTFNVPAGVTVMVDAGAVFRMRNAIVDVGSSSPLSGDSRTGASLQLLGVPGNQVKFSSLSNVAAPVGVYGPSLYQARGEWGGIVFRSDSDWQGSPAAGVRRPFVNTVQQSLVSWGGGQVVVDSNRESFAAIQVEGTRPTLAFNEITVSAGPVIAATPNSFEESDGRRGLELRGNRFGESSINGVFIKIETPLGGGIEPLEVSARLTSTEVVYVLQENLIIAGGAGGFVGEPGSRFARPSGRLQIDPGVVVKLQGARIELGRGQSQLLVEGEGLDRAILTSLADNRFGAGGTFDTNGNQPDNPVPGDWAGIFVNAGGSASIDQSYLAYAGGQSSIEGAISKFNPIEVHQGDLRLANSRLEFNADGNASDDRDNRGTNVAATVFIRGAQPVIIGNDFRANAGAVISINTNSLNDTLQGDPGRQTGELSRSPDFDDNFGPLVRNNRITATAGVAASVIQAATNSNRLTITSTNGLVPNMVVIGPGIPAGVRVVDVLSTTEVQLTAAVTCSIDLDLWFYNAGDTTSTLAAMEVRPEEITVEGVWDDVDIVHYLDGEIVVNNFHTATGLRLLSEAAASLVVKLGPNAGITASGTPLEIDDRVGGTVQVVGQPGYPVIMTSIADDTVGASLDANGFPVTDTNVDGPETMPSAGDWRGLQFLPLSNDRNVSIYKESELALAADADLNRDTENAEFLGVLAPNYAVENQAGVLNSWESAQEKSGDDNRRLGFEVHGFIATDNPGDVDLYRIEGYAGSEVWIDIDKTSSSLDTMVELLDASGNVLARSADSLGDITVVPVGEPEVVAELALGGNTRTYNLAGANILPGTLSGVVYAENTAQATFTVARDGTFTFTDVGTNPNFPVTSGTLNRDAGVVDLVFGATPPTTRIEVSYEHSRLTLATLGFTVDGLHGGYSLEKDVYRGADSYSTNPRDAGMRVELPGNRGTLSSYFIRVRSQPRPAGNTPANFEAALDSTVTPIDSGATSGRYELRLRLRQQDEKPGSIVRYASLNYPQIGIDVLGLPNNSLLVGTTGEATGDNNSLSGAQELGNLLTSDRNTISLAGEIGSEADVDWYTFTADYDMIQSIGGVNSGGKTWAAVFDIDYADGFRGDLTLSVFDKQGTLIYIGRDSDVADDQADPSQQDNDIDDLSRGSMGKLDPFIGTVQLPAGGPGSTTTYYVAVSSSERMPTALNAYFVNSALNSNIRLEPITSLERVVEDHIGTVGYYADDTSIGIIDTTNAITLSANVRPFTLSDVTLFVSTGSSLFTVDAYRGGGWETRIANGTYNNGSVGDIDMRPDGTLLQYYGANGDGGNNGLLRVVDTATGAILSSVGDGIADVPATPAATDWWKITGQSVDAVAIKRRGVGNYSGGYGTGSTSVVYSVQKAGESYLYTTINSGSVEINAQGSDTTRIQLTGGTTGRTGTATGLQFADDTNTLYGITDTGQFFRPFNQPTGFDADFSLVLNPGETFEGLAAGPVNLENGRYQGTFFAITSQGRLVNIDPNGLGANQAALVANVFDTNADGYADSHISNPTVSGATGLAFSPLDVNLWHPTTRRGDLSGDPVPESDEGHGINDDDPDDTRNISSAGGRSMYFGLEDWDTRSGGFTSYGGSGQYGTVNLNAYNWQQELTQPDTGIGNNYNLPGGAYGSLITNPFSLSEYAYTDKPTLYFNYFLETQGASSNGSGMRDGARVFVSTDDGLTWSLLATNNSTTSTNNGGGEEAELPAFLTVSSAAGTMDNQHVQELFDAGEWRQARVDLGKWAGESNIRLRFDFTTAGEMDPTDRSTATPDATGRVNGPGAAVGSPVITLQSVEGLQVGMFVRSPADDVAIDDTGVAVLQEIPAGATIVAIDPLTNQITLSDNVANDNGNGLNNRELFFFRAAADLKNDINGLANSTGNFSGSDSSRERGADNAWEGFYVDDIIVGFAERGEMVTGALPDQTAFYDLAAPYGSTSEYPAQILDGHYQLEIRRGTEYAANTSGLTPQLGIYQLFDTNDRLVRQSPETVVVLEENPLDAVAGSVTTRGSGVTTPDSNGLRMSGAGHNAIFWSIDLLDQPNVFLEYEYRTGSTEKVTPLPQAFSLAGGLAGGVAGDQLPTGDGVAVSLDGGLNWTTISGFAATSNAFKTRILDLAAATGAPLTDSVVIGFFQDGSSAAANVGITVRNAIITTSPQIGTSGLVGDTNSAFELQQGQFLIEANTVMNSETYGIRIDAGRQSDGSQAPHLGVPRNLPTLNNARLVPGVVVSNNVVAGSGTAGIYFAGTADAAGQPDSAIPYGRIINNTIYGSPAAQGPQGNGIEVRENASPTLMNNVFAELATAVSVDDSSRAAGTVLAYSAFQNVGVQASPGMVSFNGVDLGARAFVDPNTGNFYPFADIGDPADPSDNIDNAMIDSSINVIQDRSSFTVITTAIGVPASPVVAPRTDLYGLVRDDDPDFGSTAGVGSNAFKDRGAIERLDTTQPFGQIAAPLDQGIAPLDDDPAVDRVAVNGSEARRIRTFAIQLNDVGIGIDKATVVNEAFVISRDGAVLVEGIDYQWLYNQNTNQVLFLATSVFPLGEYRIDVLSSQANPNASVPGQVIDLANNQLRSNSVGNGTSFFIALADVPTVPLNLVATAADASVALSWEPSSTSVAKPVENYKVQWVEYTPGISPDWGAAEETETNSNATTFTVVDPDPANPADAGPENYKQYVFRVAAWNDVGWGDFSEASSEVVPRRVIDAPTGLSGVSTNLDIVLNWTAPAADAQNPITGYLLEYSIDGGTTWLNAVDVDGNSADNTATLSGLSQGVTYEIRVAAVTTVALSGEVVTGSSATTSVTVIGVPAQVTGLVATPVNDGSLQIDWALPGDGGSPLTGYEVEYSLSDPAGTPAWTPVTHTGLGTTVTLAGAIAGLGDPVWVQVRASNIEGAGGWSDPLATFMPDVPIGTLSVSAGALANDGTVTLAWTYQPDSVVTELPLTTFVIEYREVGSSVWLPFAETSGSASYSYIVTGLNAGIDYEFQLTAGNALGFGVSATATATPLAAPADAPMNLTVAAHDSAVQLDWVAPSFVPLAGADYRVQWAEYTDGEGIVWTDQQIAFVTGSTHIVIDPDPADSSDGIAWPENYKRYVFRLAVRKGGGWGGYSQTSSVVVPRRVVDAPTSLAGSSINQDVSLSWTAPAADPENPITGYLIEYSLDSGVTWSIAADTDGNSTDDTATISGLAQGVTYDIRVAAVTTVTLSSEEVIGSAATVSVTIQGVPAQVTGLSATPQTDGSLQLDWTVPGDGGSVLTGYAVEYSLSDPAGTPTWTSYPHSGTVAIANLSGAIDNNLVAGAAIWVRVRAANASGDGAWSDTVAAAMPTVPAGTLTLDAPDVSANDGLVNLTWAYQEPALAELPVTAYVIEYRTGGGAWQSAGEVTASAAGYTVVGLTNGTSYDFQVIAKNDLGNGASAISGPATPREPADAPQNLQAAAGDAEVVLTWDAPTADGGTSIVDYEVEMSTNGGNWTLVNDGVTAATGATVSNLVNGVQYRFQVRAVTAGGSLRGDWAGMAADVVPLGLATAPQNFTAVPAADAFGGKIDLAWTAPISTGGRPVTGYVIQYAEESQNIEDGASISVGVISAYLIEGLDPGSSYVFRVAALTAVGQGAWVTSTAVAPELLHAPVNLRSERTASSITVAWDEPDAGYGSGSAINYEVEISQGGQLMTRLTNGASWSTFNNLSGQTTFAIRVRAILANGTAGQWSAVHLATTL